MGKVKEFLKRKDIVFSVDRYLIKALSAMAQGLFASLLAGLIVKTIGEQLGWSFLVDIGTCLLYTSHQYHYHWHCS